MLFVVYIKSDMCINKLETINSFLRKGFTYQDRDISYKFIGILRNELITKGIVSYRPLWVGMKVTSACNFNCCHCWVDKRDYEPTFEEIVLALKKLKKMQVMHITITGGEPFLRKDIIKILEEVKKSRFSLEIFTNASLLNKKLIMKLSNIINKQTDLVQISFDAFSAEVFQLQRPNVKTSDIVQNIRELILNGIQVRLNFTATHLNQHEIVPAYKKAQELGVKVFSVSHVFDLNKGKLIYEKVNKIDFLRQIESGLRISKNSRTEFRPFIPVEYYAAIAKQKDVKHNNMKKCEPILDWFIHSNGDIFPDVTLEYKEFCLGNIYTDKIEKIEKRIKEKRNLMFYRDLEGTKCEYCDQYYFCGGGEKGRAFREYKNVNNPDSRCKADFRENE